MSAKKKTKKGKFPQSFFDLMKQENLHNIWCEKNQIQKTIPFIQTDMRPFPGLI